MTFANPNRRSGRLARRLKVRLCWNSSEGERNSVEGYTEILSRYGCIVRCATPLRVPLDLTLDDVDRRKKVDARVVYREVASVDTFKLALEFVADENFWGISFPPATAVADTGA